MCFSTTSSSDLKFLTKPNESIHQDFILFPHKTGRSKEMMDSGIKIIENVIYTRKKK